MVENFFLIAITPIITAYLYGSIPFSYLIGLYCNVDIRTAGSSNIGATNVLRTCGTIPAAWAYTLDITKGIVAGIFISFVIDTFPIRDPSWVIFLFILVAYTAPVIGHTWSVFLGFKGGKGVATSAGVLITIIPAIFLLTLVIFFITLFRKKSVGISSVIASVFLPIGCALQQNNMFSYIPVLRMQTHIHQEFPICIQMICLSLSIVVVLLHKNNLQK